MKRRRANWWIVGCALLGVASGARGQTMLKVNVGWGDAMRMGRWTPVFVAVANPQTREVDLQIHGTYGEKSLAVWVHQIAVAQPRPTTYELLFPLNGQPARIEVIVSDEKTGRTLAAQALQNPASFSPAGRVPMRLLGPNDFLAGISGEIGDAMRLQAQLNQAGLVGGILDPIRLPANFIGYDGVSVLVLAAADLAEVTAEQERAILQWVGRGGNLVFIPGTTAMPSRSDLVEALPCEIGVNRTIAGLNGRELSPRAGAAAVTVRGQTGYERRLGLGYILVLPMDIAPVQFADAKGANAFWRSMLAGMARVPGIHEPTEMVLSDEQDILIPGPNAADSVGRGRRESVAIRHVLELLGATGSEPPVDWHVALLWMAGIFLLIGPVDSIILMRLGQRPRNWVTIVGWVGLLASVGLYVAIRPGDSPVTVRSLRVVDQVDNSAVAATDIVAVNSPSAKWVRMGLDEDEWWEPANQAARSYGPERFVDASCHEDKKGCRPEWIRLIGGEAQAWHGETVAVGGAVLRAKLRVRRDRPGNVIVSGTLTNVSKNTLSDIQIETADGNCRVGKSLGAGESMEVDEALGNQGIAMNGLPADVGDVAPDRADRVEQMVKSGFGCVYGQMEGDRERREVVRAVVGLGSHGG
ncbi:MAG TPA: hypothetical protein VHX86_16275 [Tepidisphaeraceae bacterium]|jgi:hypothetical protein|nr:hypothetical protein [Tepidisphaeraceae bacterium]